MKCDFCDQKATVFLTQLVEGQMTKVRLCDACAKERGVTDPTGFSLGDLLLGGLPGGPGTVAVSSSAGVSGNGKKCETCGFTLEDLRRVRRLGCSDCYATFSDELNEMLRNMHKGISHIGKVPEGMMALQVRNQRLDGLRTRLEQAVVSENYEEAAAIRDEIHNLEDVKS